MPVLAVFGWIRILTDKKTLKMKHFNKIRIELLILMGMFLCPQVYASSVIYYMYDKPAHSITSVVDNTGAVVNAYKYNSFGGIISKTEEINNIYTYAAEQDDAETGFIFLRNRYYSPDIGRFVTKDLLYGVKEVPQTINSYAYVSNNPIRFTDPLGLGEWRNEPLFGLKCTFAPWANLKHNQYYYDNPNHNFGFMANGKPMSETYENILPGSPVGKRDDIIMEQAYIETNKTWDMYYGFPPGFEWNLPGTWKQWRPWNWHNCQDYKRAVDKNYFRIKKSSDNSNGSGGPPGSGGGPGGGGFGGSNGPNPGGGPGPVNRYNFDLYGSFYNNPYFYGVFGGVSLSKTADLMLNIQDIDGATYDEASGQVILYGKQNTSLPNMDLNDLAVAIRSVYGVDGTAADPGVSIGTEASDVPGQMKVRYDGETLNTKFGDVMFESDRLLKCLVMGKDNITGAAFSSGVPGYENILERYRDNDVESFPQNSDTRMWFLPKEIKLVQSQDNSSMVFDTATMKVLTEPAYLNSSFYDREAESFAAHFTQNYDLFAEEFPVLKDLKRLAKITSVVKWIKDNSIPFDLSFFENYTPQFYSTPQYTPPTTASISWTEPPLKIITVTVAGGVVYTLDSSNFSTSTNTLADTDKAQAVDARPADNSFMWEFNGQNASGQSQQYTAVAQSLGRSKKDGNVNITEVDMSFPAQGDNPVSFVRYYDSFDDKSTGFGQGWQITPYSLRFPDTPRTFPFGKGALLVSAHYQIFVREGAAERLYTLSGLDANGLPVYKWEGGSNLLKDCLNGTFLLGRRNNGTVLFDSNGQVTKIIDKNGIPVVYSYGGSKLIYIGSGNYGLTVHYDGDKITSITGPQPKIVTYTYYGNGQLKTATDPEGQTTTYSYDSDNRLIEIDDPKGNRSYQATYDDYNRAVTETTGSAQYSSQYSLGDRETVITDSSGTQTTMFFDTDYKLLQSEDFLNNKVNFTYVVQSFNSDVVQSFGPDSVTDPEGKVTEYKYDSQGNVCYVKDPQGYESFFFYDSNNNMVASRDELGHDVTYLYDNDNRLIEVHHVAIIDYDPASGPPQNAGSYNQTYDPAYVTKFTYDNASGDLLSTADAAGRAVNTNYDLNGMPLTITTPSGYQVATTYDKFSRATSITDQGGENVTFEYDNVDRVKKITTAAGSINYAYDKNGNIDTVYDGKNNATGFGYDANNNLVTVTDAEGGLTSYEYDVMGNLTKITMPNGSTKEITYDEAGRPISEINRRANPAPQMMVLVSSLNFGSISSGTSIEKDITVYNVGDADLSITGVSADNSVFTVSPTSSTVLPHGELTLAVTYMAPAAGNSSGNLTIHCNDSNDPTVTISLSGSAIQQSLNTNATSTLNGMLVTWNKYMGTGSFDHYSVYRSSSVITDISGLTPLQTIADINQTSYLDSTTTLQSQYYYSVVAFDSTSNTLTPTASTKPVTYLNLGKIGGAIDIASSSHNEQNVSVIYNNSSKEYLLIYEYDSSGAGTNYDIYGQRLAENGTKIGSAFPILNSSYNERNAQVVWNSSRSEYMAICEYDSDGTGTYKIRMQRFSATGSILGSPIETPVSGTAAQFNPAIAYDSVDNRYAIGFDSDYYGVGGEQVLFLVLDADGNLISGSVSPQDLSMRGCKIAYNPSQNNYLAVFEFVYGSNTFVTGMRFDSVGAGINSYLNIGFWSNNDMRPNVFYDSNRGEYVVIWQFDDYYGTPGNYETAIEKISSDGVPGNHTWYSTSGWSMLWPTLSVFGSRNEYLITLTNFSAATNEYNIYSQRISAVDLSVLTNSAINVAIESSSIERKAVTVFDPNDNEFLVAYERASGSDCNIVAQRIGQITTLLDIEPASLDFGTDLTQQTIQVTNISGEDSMHLENYTYWPWLSVTPDTVDAAGSNPTTTLTISVNRSGLPAGNYSGYVDVTCEGIGSYVPVTMTVANLPPNSPTNPTPVTGATGQAVLGTPLRVATTWQCTDPQGGVLNYDVYLSDNQSLVTNADSSVLVAQSQNSASYVSPALGYNKTYYWRVKSKDSGGLTALGDVWSFTTIPIAAPVLIPPTINTVNTGKPVFQWNAVDGAALYHVEIDNDADFSSPIVNVANVATTKYTPSTDLPEGTIYWRVSAIDAQGDEGAFSSSTSSNTIIVDITPPPQVTIIAYAPDPTNNQKPTLTWNPSIGASLYHVQIAGTSDFSTLLFNGYVSETTYTSVSDLPEGKIWWRVSTKDLAGNESQYSSPGNFTIDITPPGAIHITSTKGGLENIKITWDMFNDVGGDFHNFNIYRSESVITNVSGMTPINQSITDKTIVSSIDTTAVSGKTYYYVVTAVDTAGNEYKQVTSFGPATIDRVPTLDWAGDTGYESSGLSPLSGSGTTVFTFKIKYTDLDDDIPTIHKVYIDMNGDGNYSAFDMTTTGTDYASGVIYTYTTTIPYSQTSQNHSYYFVFSDELQSATANITQGLSQATAIHKPDVFQTLSLTIDHALWQLLNIAAGSEQLTDASNKIRVTNNGDGLQTYSLNITDQGGWTASADKNGADVNTFVLSAIFTGDTDVGIDATYFNEIGNDDVVLASSTDRASSTRFGSTRLSQNGISVPIGAVRSLWLDLKAPSKDTTTKGATHSVGVTINAEAS